MSRATALETTNRNHSLQAWVRTPVQPKESLAGLHSSLEITNSTQILLNYEVFRVGPSGLGSVELYLTQDEGAPGSLSRAIRS